MTTNHRLDNMFLFCQPPKKNRQNPRTRMNQWKLSQNCNTATLLSALVSATLHSASLLSATLATLLWAALLSATLLSAGLLTSVLLRVVRNLSGITQVTGWNKSPFSRFYLLSDFVAIVTKLQPDIRVTTYIIIVGCRFTRRHDHSLSFATFERTKIKKNKPKPTPPPRDASEIDIKKVGAACKLQWLTKPSLWQCGRDERSQGWRISLLWGAIWTLKKVWTFRFLGTSWESLCHGIFRKCWTLTLEWFPPP